MRRSPKKESGSPDVVIRPAQEVDNDHFRECIRLHSMDKICEGNAFTLKLIDLVYTLLNQGMFRNFELAARSLAAGTSIYAARVDRIYRSTCEVMSKLSVALVDDNNLHCRPDRKAGVSSPVRGRDQRLALNSSGGRGRPKIISPGYLSKIRLRVRPQDDFLFKHQAGNFDSCSLDNAGINFVVGSEEEQSDKNQSVDLDMKFVSQLHELSGLEICPLSVLRKFRFMENYVYLRSCRVVLQHITGYHLPAAEKRPIVKQECEEAVKKEICSGESDAESVVTDIPESLKVPINCLDEIRCDTVEQYVEMLNENLRTLLARNGELLDHCVGDLHNNRRRSTRKRPCISENELRGSCTVNRKRKRNSGRKRPSPAIRNEKKKVTTARVKEEILPTIIDEIDDDDHNDDKERLDPTIETVQDNVCFVDGNAVIGNGFQESDISDIRDVFVEAIEYVSSDSEGDVHICETRTSTLAIPSKRRKATVNVRAIIQCIRVILCCKTERLNEPKILRFSDVLQQIRNISHYSTLTPAIVLFCLLHVAEREDLRLESTGDMGDLLIVRSSLDSD